MFTPSPQPPRSVSPCSPIDELGRVFESELEFPSYKIPLSDHFLLNRLTNDELTDVCRSTMRDGKYGYYFESPLLEELRRKLKPENVRLPISAVTEVEENGKSKAKLQAYLSNPPPSVSARDLDSARFFLVSISFSPEEAAYIRYVIDDPASPPDSSLLRRVRDPLHKIDEESGRYAFSIGIDAAQYDKVLANISYFQDPIEVGARAKLIEGEIKELKKQIGSREAPPKPLVIPDSYFPKKSEIGIARQRIAELQKNPPRTIKSKTEMGILARIWEWFFPFEKYHIHIREHLFPEEVAFLRYLLDDYKNTKFIAYFPDGAGDRVPRPFKSRRDIDWQKLVDELSRLANTCHGERQDFARCHRATVLFREAERLQRQVREESAWYQFKQHGLPIAYAFTFAGASFALIAKGPAIVRWVIEKTRKGPPPPASGGATGDTPSPVLETVEPDTRVVQKAAKVLAWGAATAGAAALTLTSGAAMFAVARVPGAGAAAASATAYSAGLAATAAAAFYLSSRNFLQSVFEPQ